jgi:hypothetical protein
MAFRLARLRDFGLTGLPSALLTWSQRVAEQIEAEVGALTEADAAMAAAIAAQNTADSKAKVTRDTVAPASPNVNDVWVDSSVSPVITKTWNGTAWVVAATEGADLATNVTNNDLGNVTDTASRKALATNAVQTSYIQNNAVTNPTSAYSTGSVSVPDTGAWTDLQTVTISATGAPINVHGFFYAGFSEYAGTGASNIALYRVIRDATVIFGPVNLASFVSGTTVRGTGPNPALVLDQPASGSRTYKLQAWFNDGTGGGTLAPIFRSLVIMEAKK